MAQRVDYLVDHAELLLDLFGNKGAQRDALLAIERELKARGESRSSLYRRIDSLCQDNGEDPKNYRCRYELVETDQQPLDEHFYDVTH
ncbi:MAG: hypothetical protein OQK12_11255 [Motiliproteus sp.]|nr:hypothetical protein [Motiliproteus sp.]MCW9053025.1 hypothetical protein [Motiliproteus sp.]